MQVLKSDKDTIYCNLSNDKLCEEEWKLIESKMYARGESITGFLDPIDKLRDVIKEDQKTLEQLSITYKQITDRLKTIINKSCKTCLRYKEICTVESKFIVKCESYMGAQKCPFQNKDLDNEYHGYSYGDSDFTFINVSTNESIWFNTLLPHMIDAHHFFEGNVQHRLDPELVVRVLEILPGVDYTPVQLKKLPESLDLECPYAPFHETYRKQYEAKMLLQMMSGSAGIRYSTCI